MTAPNPETAKVRQWAYKRGLTDSPTARGRLSNEIVDKYNRAHPKRPDYVPGDAGRTTLRLLAVTTVIWTVVAVLALSVFHGATIASAQPTNAGDGWCHVPVVDQPGQWILTEDFETGWGQGSTYPFGPAPCAPTACPAPYHMGSSGCQVEPWLPEWVEDRGDSHTATSSTTSVERAVSVYERSIRIGWPWFTTISA